VLSDTTRQRIEGLMRRYPQARSALIPSLRLAQEEAGYLSPEAIADVAGLFRMHPNEVYDVASFYTMLYKKPVGRYVVAVCTNISCLLCDSDSIMARIEARLGIRPGETTSDRRFTLMEVECLASCDTAPVVQINDEYHERLTPERLDGILDNLA